MRMACSTALEDGYVRISEPMTDDDPALGPHPAPAEVPQTA